jgi:hypothetical protein
VIPARRTAVPGLRPIEEKSNWLEIGLEEVLIAATLVVNDHRLDPHHRIQLIEPMPK